MSKYSRYIKVANQIGVHCPYIEITLTLRKRSSSGHIAQAKQQRTHSASEAAAGTRLRIERIKRIKRIKRIERIERIQRIERRLRHLFFLFLLFFLFILYVLSIQYNPHTINAHNFCNMRTGRERRRLGASQ